MQIFQSDNHEFVLGKVLKFGEVLQERGTKRAQLVVGHHLDQ
jgi:hypothetical protein